jgi:EF hand
MKPIMVAAAVAILMIAAGSALAQVQGRGGALSRIFEDADANHDGVITKAEFGASRAGRFVALDADRDGFVTQEEMRAGVVATGPRQGAGQRLGIVARADTNGDGNISKEEYFAASARLWARLDVNKDGMVDATEIASLPRARWGADKAAGG